MTVSIKGTVPGHAHLAECFQTVSQSPRPNNIVREVLQCGCGAPAEDHSSLLSPPIDVPGFGEVPPSRGPVSLPSSDCHSRALCFRPPGLFTPYEYTPVAKAGPVFVRKVWIWQ